jgi:hypothetical protein
MLKVKSVIVLFAVLGLGFMAFKNFGSEDKDFLNTVGDESDMDLPKVGTKREIKDSVIDYGLDVQKNDNIDKDSMKIKKEVWQGLLADKSSLEEKLRLSNSDKEDLIESAKNNEKLACIESTSAAIKQERDAAIGEAVKMVAELSTRVAVYSFPSAIVNGNCTAFMKDGHARHLYVVNGCLNVIKKEVGNTGDIDGITKSVSKRASEKGIMNVQCFTGDANIKMLKDRCDDRVSSQAELFKVGGNLTERN